MSGENIFRWDGHQQRMVSIKLDKISLLSWRNPGDAATRCLRPPEQRMTIKVAGDIRFFCITADVALLEQQPLRVLKLQQFFCGIDSDMAVRANPPATAL